AFMHQAVMVVAEGKQVGQAGRPASTVELDVVWTRPVDRPVAFRKAARAVPCLEGRHCAGETACVAWPTSTTTESALSTRLKVPSQARRCTVLLETGIPFCISEAAAPSSPFRPSIVVFTLMWGRAPLRRGMVPASRAW